MKYLNTRNFDHQQQPRIGVLLTNLGTPDAPTRKDVRRYLKEFLWDPRIVELPRPLWWLILNGVILTVRPGRSAAAYRSVWTEAGSPLLLNTQAQAAAVQDNLTDRYGDQILVRYAMRYGNPSMSSVLEEMFAQGVRKLVVLPLYPQYSATTTASTFDALAAHFTQRRWLPDLRFVSHYHDNPSYIKALAQSIRRHWDTHGRADKLVFSFHGIPKQCLTDGDPYHCECLKTSRLVAEALSLEEETYLTTFQSRVGRQEWLTPYTDETMKTLPSQQVQSVQVICPGFSSDCLETVEEIDVENRGYFMQAGGERYEYIPCLNAEPDHIQCLSDIVVNEASDWLAN